MQGQGQGQGLALPTAAVIAAASFTSQGEGKGEEEEEEEGGSSSPTPSLRVGAVDVAGGLGDGTEAAAVAAAADPMRLPEEEEAEAEAVAVVEAAVAPVMPPAAPADRLADNIGAVPDPAAAPVSASSTVAPPRLPPLDPRTPALLLVNCQNEYASYGGLLNEGVEETTASTGMLQNTIELVVACRKAGVLVIHSPLVLMPSLPAPSFGLLSRLKELGALEKDSWGADICDELAPGEGDVLLSGRRGLDAFGSLDLDFVLRKRGGITALAVGGFLASVDVESNVSGGGG